jgi:hypothetical protein
MRAIRFILAITLGAVLLFTLASCDREITRVEQTALNPADCFQCHSDQDTRLVAAEAQWANSVHASGHNIDRNTPPCSGCHTGNGFVARAEGEEVGTYPNPTMIHCFTCHAPHTNRNLSLRVNEVTLADGTEVQIGEANICASCHQSRQDVNTYVSGRVTLSTHWGPHHGPQADMLLATNGYEYDGYTYEDLRFHRGATKNGCLDCHFEFTQNFVVGGHSFNMVALLDGEGMLLVDGCNVCHDNLDSFDYHDIPDSVRVLEAVLAGLLEEAGLLEDGEPTSVTTSADSAGAVWNYLIVEEDRSNGVHNSKYEVGLLQSSIDFLNGDLTPEASPAAPADGDGRRFARGPGGTR